VKFTNVSGDDRVLVGVGLVEAGKQTPDLTDEQAEGVIHQTDVWRAVGVEARKEQAAAATEENI
jgi:hypothetical protein